MAIVMQQPPSLGSVPTNGLDYLKELEFVKIRQKVDIAELFLPFDVKNRYEILDSNEMMFFYVFEEKRRKHCQFGRDLQKVCAVKEVGQFSRKFKCCGGCCCCANFDSCSFDLWMGKPDGSPVSHIRQMKYCCYPRFNIISKDEKTQYHLHGPCCCMCQGPGCFADLEFLIYNPDGSETHAKVTKIWSGAGRECCTKANTFGCYFPKDLDVEKKLSVIGSAFQIDFTFFEGQGEQ